MNKLNLKQTIELFLMRTVPLVVVFNALDLLETTTSIVKTIDGYMKGENHPTKKDYTVIWDCIRGLQVEECPQKNWAMAQLGDEASQMTSPLMALEQVERLMHAAKESGVFYAGAFIFYMSDIILHPNHPDRDSIVQYLLILREKLTEMRSVVILVGIDFDIPASLKEHVALVGADLPDDEQYKSYVLDVQQAYEKGMTKKGETDAIIKPDEDEVLRLRDTIRGQTSFGAKQSLYLSITPDAGLSRERLQERAIHTINSTRGLSVIKGDGRGFEAIGGMESIKRFSKRIIDSGKVNLRVICFIDEINLN